MNDSRYERSAVLRALAIPSVFIIIMWVLKMFEWLSGIQLYFLGLYPLSAKGLPGILLSPLLHGDFNHLIANTVPFFVLAWALFYFYRQLALRILFTGWIVAGIWVWLFARDSYHIGASGLVYALAAFHVLSGIIRHNMRLVAFAMLVIFLYGSLFWGVFPDFFPHQNVSWESHLMGAIAGLVLAVYYRKDGPDDDRYHWEDEEDEEDENEDEQEEEDISKPVSEPLF